LLWHRNFRYYKREAKRVASVVDEYANPNIGAALGLHGELMVLEAFARAEFVMRGRETRGFRNRSWSKSDHDLDFVFERDGIAYGVEVKNTLGYMNYDELLLKIELCKYLNLRPVFVVRMMPKSWMFELIEAGGFGLILKYQLYPWTHKELGRHVARELGLPIDSPRAIQDGTMTRFLKWHKGLLAL
jgi:hypothetical protein